MLSKIFLLINIIYIIRKTLKNGWYVKNNSIKDNNT